MTLSPDKAVGLIERIERARPDDWRLNEEIIRALGGNLRVVSRLGLSGRTRGGYRVFWPTTKTVRGAPVPNFLADDASKAKAIQRLNALRSQPQ